MTLEARLGRAVASGDQTTQHPPFLNSPHWGLQGLQGGREEPGAAKIVTKLSRQSLRGDVTAADISRIVAVTTSQHQSVAATTLDTASVAAG